LSKNQFFGQQFNFWLKIHFLATIQLLAKKSIFCPKIQLLAKNPFFAQKIQILSKNPFFGNNSTFG